MTSRILARAIIKAILSHPAVSKTAKGFTLAYLYVILPRVFAYFSKAASGRSSFKEALQRSYKVAKRGLLSNRFPTFVARTIFGVYALEHVLSRVVSRNKRSNMFVSSLIASAYAFYNYKRDLASHPVSSDTTDITLTFLVRGLDMLVRTLAARRGVSQSVLGLSDVALFTFACFFIMFAWFYYPERLPPSYRKWITMAANMDDELIDVLRGVRKGEIVYGESKYDDHLKGMCERIGMDPEVGKFSNKGGRKGLPCRLVHRNVTDNCEVHALYRFYRGFTTAISIYLPLNVLVALPSLSWKKAWKRIIFSSSRSSAFLAAFITLNWYCVCIARTRLGPKLFPKATAQQLEDSWGPGLGSLTCGLSSLVETPKRRGELALFVSPRALSVALPNEFHEKYFRTEVLLFALSFATILTGVQSGNPNIRGVFRRLMGSVF